MLEAATERTGGTEAALIGRHARLVRPANGFAADLDYAALDRALAGREQRTVTAADAAAVAHGGSAQPACWHVRRLAADLSVFLVVVHSAMPSDVDQQGGDALEMLAAIAARYWGADGTQLPLLAAVEAAQSGVTLADATLPDLPLIYVNAMLCRMTGYRRADFIGRNCRFLQADDREQPGPAEIRDALAGGQPSTTELWNYRADGSAFRNRLDIAPVHNASGMVTHFIGLQQDITREHELEQRLTAERDRMVAIIEASPAGLVVLNDEGRVRFANPAAEQLLARSRETLVGADFGVPVPSAEPAELGILRPDGRIGVAEFTVIRSNWDGEPAWLGMLYDVTARKEAEEEVSEMAHTDHLTGLANRVRLRERLKIAKAQARRTGELFALLMLDLDRFKQVNDSMGHPAGDHLLQDVAARLESVVRARDTVARLGGDEFAILAEGVDSADGAMMVADKVLATFAEPFEIDEYSILVGASVGIALLPQDSTDVDSLLSLADMAMFAAKGVGGSTARRYTSDMAARNSERMDVEQRLRRGLDRDELVVHYQPQVRLADETLAGFEALVRWQDPQRGLVGPDQFIRAVEELGLIEKLGAQVFAIACRQVAAWEPRLAANVTMAVNLSARQVRGPELLDYLQPTIAATGVEAERLVLELTESAAAESPKATRSVLSDLRQRGMRIALDDFGTGFSALNELRTLPIDQIKIDRSFLAGVPGDSAGEALIHAIIGLSHGVGKTVLAEGVETREQATFLRAAGCDYAQGFLYDRALPAADIDQRWLPASQSAATRGKKE